MEHEGDFNIDRNWRAWNSPQMLGKEAGRVGIRRKNRDH